MFGSVGIPELIMIFIVALLLFGPKKLPEIGRSLGKALGEFKRATNDLQHSLEEEVAADELRQTKRELDAAIKPEGTAAAQSQPAAPAAGARAGSTPPAGPAAPASNASEPAPPQQPIGPR